MLNPSSFHSMHSLSLSEGDTGFLTECKGDQEGGPKDQDVNKDEGAQRYEQSNNRVWWVGRK